MKATHNSKPGCYFARVKQLQSYSINSKLCNINWQNKNLIFLWIRYQNFWEFTLKVLRTVEEKIAEQINAELMFPNLPWICIKSYISKWQILFGIFHSAFPSDFWVVRNL